MGGAIKPGSLFCMAHQRKITEDDIQNRNCLKGCKYVAEVVASGNFEDEK